jgi:branched-chain amino acid transport system substrate-binding protein
MKRSIMLVATALVLAGLAGAAVVRAADPPPAKLGIGLGLTGPLAFLSQEYLKGMRAAVDLVNRDGGVGGGRKLVLVERDHKGVPSEAVAVAKRFIEQDRVDIVDIDLPSTVPIAVQPVTKQAKMPQVTGYGFSPGVVEQGNPYHFRVCTNTGLIASVLAESIRAMPNNRAIAMLAPNDDYGRGAIKSLTDALQQPGSPKVVFSDYYEREQTDFTAVLLKMKSLNPDSLYIDVRWPANVTVLKQMTELGLKKQLFGSVNFFNTKLVERAGGLLEGAYMSVAWAPMFQDAASTKFIEAYKRLHNNETPNDSASLGWTAAMVAATALRMAGPGANGDAIRAALAKLEWQAPQGIIKFDDKGDARVPAHVLQFKNGAYHLVK